MSKEFSMITHHQSSIFISSFLNGFHSAATMKKMKEYAKKVSTNSFRLEKFVFHNTNLDTQALSKSPNSYFFISHKKAEMKYLIQDLNPYYCTLVLVVPCMFLRGTL